jgi:ABC-type transporter MlaC component
MPLALAIQPPLETSRPFIDELPKDALRRTIRDLMEAPDSTTEASPEVGALFDVAVITRRCLGRHWPEQTPADRAEFTRSVASLLASTLRETLEFAGGIRYTTQSTSGPLVTVRAEVDLEGRTPAALELRAHRVRGRWLLNDFVVDGTSFVAQHRARLEHALARPAVSRVS